MFGAKQMMDIRSSKERISGAESNEQQRNWNKNMWSNKANDPLKNYDPTRAHLNFEVTRGGKIQSIDTSMSIDEKMNQILQERGITNPNERDNAKRKNRILAQFILGGNRERMREIAFGDQTVEYGKNADNSKLTRKEDIEKWAVDAYNFVAKEFGEKNIVSFYVHLDETTPHAHCTVLPIDETKNRISWYAKFGSNRHEESESMRLRHNRFFAEVGEKWGLNRGSDKRETGAKHRSTAEYERDLINHVEELEDTLEGLKKQIAKEERKQKSFTTMIDNLLKRKEEIETEIGEMVKPFGVNGQDPEEVAKHLNRLRKEMEGIQQKIEERKKMLENTNSILAAAREKLDKLKEEETRTTDKVKQLRQEHTRLSEKVGDKIKVEANHVYSNVVGTFYKMVYEAIEPVLETLDREQRNSLEDSGFYDLAEKANDVISTALLLSINLINEATTYAESHGGGGGGGSTSGWGRKKDEDDENWWRRCIRQAASMMKPGRRRGRNR